MCKAFDELMEMKKEEGREEGREKGREEGEQQTIRLVTFLIQEGRVEEIPRLADDEIFRKSMLRKYKIED